MTGILLVAIVRDILTLVMGFATLIGMVIHIKTNGLW